MANKGRATRYQADRTNQKLYFCRLACQRAANTTDKQSYQAHCEEAIFHLQGVYYAFLQELAYFYGLDTAKPSIDYIEDELSRKSQVSPEIERIKQSLASGVLANIRNAFQRCQYAPMPDVEKVDSSHDLIVNVVTLSNQWLPDEQTIRQWREELMLLIEEMRGGMVEY